jgi:hypothetical protein
MRQRPVDLPQAVAYARNEDACRDIDAQAALASSSPVVNQLLEA